MKIEIELGPMGSRFEGREGVDKWSGGPGGEFRFLRQLQLKMVSHGKNIPERVSCSALLSIPARRKMQS